MTHKTFSDYGRALAKSWGFDDSGDIEAKIQNTSDDRKLLCLMAATVNELLEIKDTMIQLSLLKSGNDETSSVSDGMLRGLQMLKGEDLIPSNLNGLSFRARTAVRRSKVRLLSEITEDRFQGMRNCGEATIRELIAWAQAQQTPARQEKSPCNLNSGPA